MPEKPLTRQRLLRGRVVWIACVIVATVTGAFALWDPLDIDERAHVRRITLHAAKSVRKELATKMRSRIVAQVRLAKLWTSGEHSSMHERELRSTLFLEQYPGAVLLQWIDEASHVLWATSGDDHDVRQQLKFSTRQELKPVLEAALTLRSGDALIAPAFQLPDGRTASRIVVPVFRDGAATGFLVSVLDTRAALESMLADHRELGYSISVREGTSEIFRTPGTSRDYEDAWGQDVDLQLSGVTWRVRMWPNPDTLTEIRSSLPDVALAVGALFGLVLMITLYFARAAQLRSRDLSEARDDLDQRVRERTIELQHVNQNLQEEVAERERTEESLRRLSGRLLHLQDEERRRLARELHDSTAQMVLAVAINMEKAQVLAQAYDSETLNSLLRESAEFLERTLEELRTLTYLLHPPMLDELGLEYVLAWYVEGFSTRSGIAVDLHIQPSLGRLPHDVELTLFRIVQESLTNVHHHSGSRTANIVLVRDAVSVTLEINDQGRGISSGLVDANRTIAKLGVGIAGMRERVRQLGGRIEITGGDEGTSVRTVLPLVIPLTSDAAPHVPKTIWRGDADPAGSARAG